MICVNKAVICACIFNFSVSSQDPKFFFDKYRKYIKGQRPPSIQDVYKSASKREHKNKDPYPPLSGR